MHLQIKERKDRIEYWIFGILQCIEVVHLCFSIEYETYDAHRKIEPKLLALLEFSINRNTWDTTVSEDADILPTTTIECGSYVISPNYVDTLSVTTV